MNPWKIATHRTQGHRYYCRRTDGEYELRYTHRVGMYPDTTVPPESASPAGFAPAENFRRLFEIGKSVG